MAKATANKLSTPVSQIQAQTNTALVPITTSSIDAVTGAHYIKQGDKFLKDGVEVAAKATVIKVPTVKELKDKALLLGKVLSTEDAAQERATIGRNIKPVVSGMVSAAIADTSFIVRTARIAKGKSGMHTIGVALQQVDVEDLVHRLARLQGKDADALQAALDAIPSMPV